MTSYFYRAGTATIETSDQQFSTTGARSVPDIRSTTRMLEDSGRTDTEGVFAGIATDVGRSKCGAILGGRPRFFSERNRLTSSDVDPLGRCPRRNRHRPGSTCGLWGQVELKMTKHLAAGVGLRVERTTSDSATEAPPISRAEVDATPVAPRFELTYQTDEGDLLYLSVAKGYGERGYLRDSE